MSEKKPSCMNKHINFLSNLQDLIPTLAGLCFLYLCLGLNLTDLLENVFYLCMDVTTQLELFLILHEPIQIVANATCKVGSQQYLSYR